MKIHGVYDGIEEEDNHLPNWWLATLFLAMVFAFGYWFVYHSTHWAMSTREKYLVQKQEDERKLALQNPVSNESMWALAKSPDALADGKKTFTTICVACHRADAGGQIGPNLTDRYWLHGNKPENLHAAVTKGFLEKGMPPWGPQLGPDRTRNVVAYVLSLRNTNVPGGKAPQGELEE